MNFECLLVLNHDEETWDCLKGEVRKNRNILRHTILRRVRGIIGTCSRKPYILFWYTTYFICCFNFHFNETWDYIIILIHVFSNTNKHKLLQWTIYSYCCVKFFYSIYYDEMNYNLVFGFFYNVLWNAYSSYMK
jgi:hypothetical protein